MACGLHSDLVDCKERDALMDNTVKVDPPTTMAPTLSGEPILSWGWGTWAPEGGFHISFLSKNPSSDTHCREGC